MTSALPMRRTTDCATAACFRQTVLSVCRIVLYHRAFYFVNTLSHFPMITFLTNFPDDKLLYFFPERRSMPPDRIVINPDKPQPVGHQPEIPASHDAGRRIMFIHINSLLQYTVRHKRIAFFNLFLIRCNALSVDFSSLPRTFAICV